MKKHFQKITLFVLLIATLLTLFLPFASSAAESDGWAVKSIETSDVMEDLKAMKLKDDKGQFTIPFDESLYPLDVADKRVELIMLYEHGYTKKDGMSKDYGVYLYLYNPSGQVVKDADNMVNMCQGVDANGNATTYERVTIDLISASKDYRFLKFRLAPREDQVYFQTVKREGKDWRYYGVTSLYLNHGLRQVKAYSNNFGYVMTGYIEDDTLVTNGMEKAVIDLTLHQTWYRLNSSPLGEDHYSTLNQIYFSIPESLLSKYGTLIGAEMEWYEYKTKPVLYCTDQKMAETLKVDPGSKGFKFVSQGDNGSNYNPKFYYEMGVGDCKSSSMDYDRYYDIPSTVFYSKDVSKEGMNLITDASTGKTITGEFILEQIRNQSSSFYESLDYLSFPPFVKEAMKAPLPGASDYASKFFTDDVDEGRTRGYNHVHLSNKNIQTLEAFDNKGFFGWIKEKFEYGILSPDIEDSISYPEIQEITTLYEEDVTPRQIGINEFDLPKVKEDCEYAVNQNKRTFMLRFAVTDYFFSKELKTSSTKGNVYASEQTCFLNLNVLSLTMQKDGVDGIVETTTIAVNSDPIDVMADPTTATEQNNFLDIGIFDFSVPSFDLLDKILTFLGIALVVILVIIFAPKIFRWLVPKKKKKSKSSSEKSETKPKENNLKIEIFSSGQAEKTKEENQTSSESTEKPKEEKKKKKSFFKSFSDLFKSKKSK